MEDSSNISKVAATSEINLVGIGSSTAGVPILRISEVEKENLKLKEQIKILEEKLDENKDNSKIKELENIKKRLTEEILCPICLSIPKSKKIPVCENGHTTCLECIRGSTPTCPICSVSCRDIRFSPLALSITELFEVECMNKDKGCNVYVLKRDISEHEKICRFTEDIKCPGKGCVIMVSLETIYKHLETCCVQRVSDTPVVPGEPYSIEINNATYFCDFITCVVDIADISDKLFLCSENLGDDGAVFLVKLLSEDSCKRYQLRLEVMNKENTIGRSLLAETVHVHEDTSKALSDGNALEIKANVMQKIMAYGEAFCGNFSFTIFEKMGSKRKLDLDQ